MLHGHFTRTRRIKHFNPPKRTLHHRTTCSYSQLPVAALRHPLAIHSPSAARLRTPSTSHMLSPSPYACLKAILTNNPLLWSTRAALSTPKTRFYSTISPARSEEIRLSCRSNGSITLTYAAFFLCIEPINEIIIAVGFLQSS